MFIVSASSLVADAKRKSWGTEQVEATAVFENQ